MAKKMQPQQKASDQTDEWKADKQHVLHNHTSKLLQHSAGVGETMENEGENKNRVLLVKTQPPHRLYTDLPHMYPHIHHHSDVFSPNNKHTDLPV